MQNKGVFINFKKDDRMRCIILSLIFFISLNCSNKPVGDEYRFKEIALRLVSILRENSNLVKASERPVNNNVKIVKLDRSKSHYFLKKHKKELMQIDNSLAKISENKYTSSKIWSDDAAFCRAIQYSFLFIPNNELFEKKGNELWEIIIKLNKIKIEPWTKETLGEYYSVFFSSLPKHLNSNLTDTEIIRGGLASFIISELCVQKKYSEAKKELYKLKTLGINKLFIKNIDSMIKSYRQIERAN
jgi:hypothetical protein